MSDNKTALYQKLLAARARMSFEKAYNTALKYEILDGDQTLEMVGDALAAEGVLFTVSQLHAEVTFHQREKTYKGNTEIQNFQHALVTLELTFTDVDTGESLVLTTHGSAMDFGDKALGKAQTYGIKYAFLRNFLRGKGGLNDEEDMSRAQQDDPPARSTPRQSAPAQPRASQPASKASAEAEPPAYDLLTDPREFEPDMWAGGMCKAFVDAKLADNMHHASKRLRLIYELDHDAPYDYVIEAQTEARYTVAVLAQMFKSRQNMRDVEAKAAESEG